MRRYGLILAAVLVLVVNAFVLIGVAYNRSGNPDSQVVLTERELRLPYYLWRSDRENTGIWLNLDWNRYEYILPEEGTHDPYAWFDKTMLQSLGFVCTLSAENPKAPDYYYRLLPRRVYAVLEIGGRAWNDWKSIQEEKLAALEEKRKAGRTPEKEYRKERGRIESILKNSPRLFVVNVAKEPESLRLRYPDRRHYIITPALAGVHLVSSSDESDNKTPKRIQGYVKEILIDRIHVPLSMRIPLETVLKDKADKRGEDSRKHYEVTLRYGKRYEPWIVEIKLLNG
jgi:hypothetical protein